MSDYTTTINVKGTKEECLEIMKVLCYFANDRKKQYWEKRDCWYLDETLELPDKEVAKVWKSGEMSLLLSGPYGVWNGPISVEIPLFERLADVAPECIFSGEISGFDSGANQSIRAELKDGKLTLSYTCEEFGETESIHEYIDAVLEALPIERFSALFKVDMDEDDYWDFIQENTSDGDFLDIPYDWFLEYAETSLTEAEYAAVMKQLNGTDFPRFCDYVSEADTWSEVYDPLTKTYTQNEPSENGNAPSEAAGVPSKKESSDRPYHVKSYEHYICFLKNAVIMNKGQILSDDEADHFMAQYNLDVDWGITLEDIKNDMDAIVRKKR